MDLTKSPQNVVALMITCLLIGAGMGYLMHQPEIKVVDRVSYRYNLTGTRDEVKNKLNAMAKLYDFQVVDFDIEAWEDGYKQGRIQSLK